MSRVNSVCLISSELQVVLLISCTYIGEGSLTPVHTSRCIIKEEFSSKLLSHVGQGNAFECIMRRCFSNFVFVPHRFLQMSQENFFTPSCTTLVCSFKLKSSANRLLQISQANGFV